MPTIRDLKNHIDKYMHDDEVIAWDIWCVHDVEDELDRMNENRDDDDPEIILTQEEKEDIIEDMHRYKDCSHGLTWDNIIDGINDIVRRKQRKQIMGADREQSI